MQKSRAEALQTIQRGAAYRRAHGDSAIIMRVPGSSDAEWFDSHQGKCGGQEKRSRSPAKRGRWTAQRAEPCFEARLCSHSLGDKRAFDRLDALVGRHVIYVKRKVVRASTCIYSSEGRSCSRRLYDFPPAMRMRMPRSSPVGVTCMQYHFMCARPKTSSYPTRPVM